MVAEMANNIEIILSRADKKHRNKICHGICCVPNFCWKFWDFCFQAIYWGHCCVGICFSVRRVGFGIFGGRFECVHFFYQGVDGILQILNSFCVVVRCINQLLKLKDDFRSEHFQLIDFQGRAFCHFHINRFAIDRDLLQTTVKIKTFNLIPDMSNFKYLKFTI